MMAGHRLRILTTYAFIAAGSFAGTTTLEAPARYAHIVPRLQLSEGQMLKNLHYEGNNIVMRGKRTPGGNFVDSGQTVALRWQQIAQSCRGVFVLRDSLFSQQDHPYKQQSYALMLPPSWITSAATTVQDGRPLVPMKVFLVEDDQAWANLDSINALFGSFPRSETLYKLAILPIDKAAPEEATQIRNARTALIALAKESRMLVDAAHLGPQVIMRVGAERISLADCTYFGTEIRRKHIIPIFVENPTLKEQSEGKGAYPPGRWTDPQIAKQATQIIYRRRLRDGDIAIERYDLSTASERKRAITLLEGLIPIGEELPTIVWLWVTGPLDSNGKLSGQNALPWISTFRKELVRSNVDGRRIVLLSKPSTFIPSGPQRKSVFEAQVDLFSQQHLPMSINLSTHGLLQLLEPSSPPIAAGQ